MCKYNTRTCAFQAAAKRRRGQPSKSTVLRPTASSKNSVAMDQGAQATPRHVVVLLIGFHDISRYISVKYIWFGCRCGGKDRRCTGLGEDRQKIKMKAALSCLSMQPGLDDWFGKHGLADQIANTPRYIFPRPRLQS